MPRFVFAFPRAQASRIARFRDHAPLAVVGEIGDVVWARTEGSREEAEKLLALVPAAEVFEVLEGDRLRPLGRLVPTKRLPPLTFAPIDTKLFFELPRAKIPGSAGGEVSLRLAPGTSASGGETLLLGTLDDLHAFVDEAAAHRLVPLTFVVNDAGEVLLRGSPLPSMPGERFLLRGGVATPVGLAWVPALAPGVLREWLGLEASSLALFRRDGSLSEIPERAFGPLGRSVLHALREA